MHNMHCCLICIKLVPRWANFRTKTTNFNRALGFQQLYFYYWVCGVHERVYQSIVVDCKLLSATF